MPHSTVPDLGVVPFSPGMPVQFPGAMRARGKNGLAVGIACGKRARPGSAGRFHTEWRVSPARANPYDNEINSRHTFFQLKLNRRQDMARQVHARSGALFRPSVERLLFILALLGILLTVHLAFWYGGRTAASDPVCGAGFDCQAVLASDPALLGVSSTYWGMLFYVAVAGMDLEF